MVVLLPTEKVNNSYCLVLVRYKNNTIQLCFARDLLSYTGCTAKIRDNDLIIVKKKFKTICQHLTFYIFKILSWNFSKESLQT